MSKFSRFNAKGKNVQVGDGNKQVNVTNNFNGGGGGGSGGSTADPAAIIFGLIGLLALLMWGYTQNVSVVTVTIAAVAAVAGALAAMAALVLVFEGSVEENDVYRAVVTAAISTAIIMLAVQTRQHLPAEVVQLAQKANALKFWRTLLPYEKALVTSNFTASISMGLAAAFLLLGALRQALYAFANSNGEGWICRGHTALAPFRMRVVGIFTVPLLVLAWAALRGYIVG